MKNLPHNQANHSNPLAKFIAFIATVSVAILALMFSAVVFSILAIGGVIVGGYVWWKTRELRKQMRDFSAQNVMREGEVAEEEIIKGEVIEGEVIHVDEHVDEPTNSR
ncbi:MAG: hypothetical protein R8M11_00320 [Gallionella sp.]